MRSLSLFSRWASVRFQSFRSLHYATSTRLPARQPYQLSAIRREISSLNTKTEQSLQLTSRNIQSSLRSDPSLDTIYALSTAASAVSAALAIVRISGPLCGQIHNALTRDDTLPKPRVATVRTLREPTDQSDILDPEALILRFPAPKSVTGEDVLELHIHGGVAVVDGVLKAVARCTPTGVSASNLGKVRYAEPGEFTRRAVLNGRMDLSAAEGLGDVLSARTAEQRRLAARRTSTVKKLADTYDRWRTWLTSARGVLEGIIDFSEDQQFEETPAQLLSEIVHEVTGLNNALLVHAKNAERGELLRRGVAVALIGRPNAGKSSLLNLLVGREAAIVSEEKGTTRDVLEVGVDLRGWLCRFVDTAGLRDSDTNVGKVEQEGIRRAKQRAKESDVVIVMVAPEPRHDGELGITITIDEETLQTAKECAANGAKLILAINKSDLLAKYNDRQIQISNISDLLPSMATLPEDVSDSSSFDEIPMVEISCKLATDASTPDQMADSGIQNLLDSLVATFKSMTVAIVPIPNGNGNAAVYQNSSFLATDDANAALGASERTRQLLEECCRHLESFLTLVEAPGNQVMEDEQLEHVDLVLAAEMLRNAADCLGRITGRGERNDVEDVLGVVFEK
jgi:tRNA modification GTPase